MNEFTVERLPATYLQGNRGGGEGERDARERELGARERGKREERGKGRGVTGAERRHITTL